MLSTGFNAVFYVCSVFNLNNKNVNALIARELLGFTCTRSQTSELVWVNSDSSLAKCVNL